VSEFVFSSEERDEILLPALSEPPAANENDIEDFIPIIEDQIRSFATREELPSVAQEKSQLEVAQTAIQALDAALFEPGNAYESLARVVLKLNDPHFVPRYPEALQNDLRHIELLIDFRQSELAMRREKRIPQAIHDFGFVLALLFWMQFGERPKITGRKPVEGDRAPRLESLFTHFWDCATDKLVSLGVIKESDLPNDIKNFITVTMERVDKRLARFKIGEGQKRKYWAKELGDALSRYGELNPPK